jgi:hypothetical protein
MNDSPPKAKSKRAGGAKSQLAHLQFDAPVDVTCIRIPVPPASAMNKDRPISDLIKAQLLHIHHAESARLPRHKRDGRTPADIRTEAEAASYIASVTAVLHPEGRKKPKRRKRS